MKNVFISALIAGLCCSVLNAQTGNIGVNTPTPGSSLTVNGSFAASYKMVNVSGTVGANDYYIAYNGTGNGTLTLPVAINGVGNFSGRTYHFKNTGNAALSIAASGAELIDDQNGTGLGVSSLSIPPGYYAFLVSKGTITGTTWELVLFSSSNSLPSADNTFPFSTKATDIRQTCDATATPSSAWIRTAIVYQNTVLNKGNVVNPATGAFTAPNDGYYVISGNTQFDNGNVPGNPKFTWTALYLIKNYAPNGGGTILVQSYQPTVTMVFGSNVSCMTYLNTGETVTMASVAGVEGAGGKYEVVTSSMYGYKIANK
ncbi:hypothetical protein DRF65_08875 [Chryseobacterium pennae]|uniref:C1q domain-containing protein n=1 Tax=Chryseobacterium pennae TaxID=2258962 RepID=A0A3D9CAY4_9FLAO|nr:hypothetical protein [Chryseobacterium pennae]REC62919.1 hypothetical protein DRF65_08875 [Chryseobacterium pennae]